ncbi:helix-turn-helix domain-containing protein [Streptomyces sp. NPDC101160]|uniref:helix-turn-helix domain-containing protein n=1 Tax=Streptomyces sp. NPDC101160 TaxID=3366118 RepID=UPI0038007084
MSDILGERPTGRGVVEGAFALLDALRRRGGEAGLTELAAECGVPKGTAHRLLEQLGPVGAVERRGRRYVLGAQLFRLGQSWQPHPGLRAAARAPLHRLRATTGASVVLVVLREDRALTVASVPGRAESLLPVYDGLSLPLGPALGAALTRPGRERVAHQEEIVPGVRCVALPVRRADGRVVAAVAALVPSEGPHAHVAAAVAAAATAVGSRLTR